MLALANKIILMVDQVLKAWINPLSYESDYVYLLVGDKFNTRTLLAVLECLKDRAFHTETVYVNSLDPSRGCTLQAELIVTTSSGSDSSAMGECGRWETPIFIMPLAWLVSCAMFTKVCAAHINYLEISWFLHYPLTVWSHVCTGCIQGGNVTFYILGNISCTFKFSLKNVDGFQSLPTKQF